jgi:cell division initiation protein
MKIGPVDIRNHSFVKRGMRGLDEAEVRAYLELVADQLQETILEAEELRTKIDQLERSVVDYRGLEQNLRDSLLSAGRLSDDRLAQAEKEAQILIKEAEIQADKILLRSREEAGRLQAAIDDLRRQRITYLERFRALLRSQIKILEASVVTFDPEPSEEESALPRQPLPPPARPAASPPPQAYAAEPPPVPHAPPPIPHSADPPLGSIFGGGLHAASRREGDLRGDA